MRAAKSYYEILGIEDDSAEAEIRTAYRKTIRKFHPDLNPDHAKSEKRTRQLNVALEVLTDPKLRKRYDDKLKRMGKAEANKEFESEVQKAPWAEVFPGVFRSSESGSGDGPETTTMEDEKAWASFDSPPHPTSHFSSGGKAKGTRRRSRRIELIGHILAPLLGLIVACWILMQIRPDIFDFNDTNIAVEPTAQPPSKPILMEPEKRVKNTGPIVAGQPTARPPSKPIPLEPEKLVTNPGPVVAGQPPAGNSEVPATSSIKDRFAKLHDAAGVDLSESENQNLARQCLKLLDDAKTENDPPLAKQIAELALISARKSNDQSLIRQATLAVLSAAPMKQEAGEKPDE